MNSFIFERLQPFRYAQDRQIILACTSLLDQLLEPVYPAYRLFMARSAPDQIDCSGDMFKACSGYMIELLTVKYTVIEKYFESSAANAIVSSFANMATV